MVSMDDGLCATYTLTSCGDKEVYVARGQDVCLWTWDRSSWL